MADGDAIIQEVLLKGQDDLKAAFSAIEQAGVQMFANLQRASESTNLQKVGITAAAITGAITAVGLATFGWAQSAAAATVSLGRLADQGGTSIENITTLTAAMKIGSDDLSSAFRRMAVRIETEWPIIQKAQRDAANLMIADNLAVQGSYLALERAQVAFRDAQKTVDLQAAANTNTVRGAEISLLEAIDARRKAEGGTADPAFDERIAKQKAILNVQQAQIALAQAQKKASEDAELAENTLAQKKIDLQQAQLKLAEDIKKRNEDGLNDINKLSQFVDNLSKGIQDNNLKVNASAENMVKGLIASIGPAAQQIGELKGGIAGLSEGSPQAIEAFLKLADVFHNMDDSAKKTAIAVTLFGRGVGQEMVEQLSKGRAAIEAEQKRLADLGFVLTDLDKEKAQGLKRAFSTLTNEIGILNKQAGLAFAPNFTIIIKEITKLVEDNRKSFVDLAESLEKKVTPVVLGFVQALTGVDLTKNKNLTPEQLVDVKQWETTFTSIKTIVVAGAAVINGALTIVSSSLNAALGKEAISNFDVAFGILAVRFGGLAGIILVTAVALDKFSDGLISRAIVGFVDIIALAVEAVALLLKLLGSKIDVSEFTKASDAIDAKAKEIAKSVFESNKKAAVDIGSEFEKSGQIIAAASDKAAKASIESMKQASAAAQQASKDAQAAGAAGQEAAPKVNALNRPSGIQVIDAGQQFAADKAKGTPGVVTNPFGDKTASNSFGQIARDAEEAVTIALELDKTIKEVQADAQKISDQGFKLFAGLTGSDSDTEAALKPLEEIKTKSVTIWQFIKDQWGISPVDAQKWNVDESVFKFFGDITKTATNTLADITRKYVTDPVSPSSQSWASDAAVGSFFTGIGKLGEDTYNKLVQIMTPTPIKATDWGAPASSMLDDLVTKAQSTFDRIAQIFSQKLALNVDANVNNGGGGGGQIPFLSTGGLFQGKPGIDTNLAWLTDLEYIMNPLATRGWGVGFMHMVNTMNVDGVAKYLGNALGKFSTGGLNSNSNISSLSSSSMISNISNLSTSAIANTVTNIARSFSPQIIPHFAAGGLNTTEASPAMQHSGITLQLGNRTFVVHAPTDVVDDIRRAAVIEEATRTGATPIWSRR